MQNGLPKDVESRPNRRRREGTVSSGYGKFHRARTQGRIILRTAVVALALISGCQGDSPVMTAPVSVLKVPTKPQDDCDPFTFNIAAPGTYCALTPLTDPQHEDFMNEAYRLQLTTTGGCQQLGFSIESELPRTYYNRYTEKTFNDVGQVTQEKVGEWLSGYDEIHIALGRDPELNPFTPLEARLQTLRHENTHRIVGGGSEYNANEVADACAPGGWGTIGGGLPPFMADQT